MEATDVYLTYQAEADNWVAVEEGKIPEHTATFAVMNGKGDSKYIWNANNPVEVEAARELFKKMKEKGMSIFRLKDDDVSRGELVREFNPSHQRLLFVPAVVGG